MRDGSHEEEGEFSAASDSEGLGEGPTDEAIDCGRDDMMDNTPDLARDITDDEEVDADGDIWREGDGERDARREGTAGLSYLSVSFV